MASLEGILQQLEGRLGPVTAPLEPLEGGITNRNFRVSFGDRDYVVRLYGKDTALLGISREAERVANEAAARLGIAPGVAAAGEGFMATRFVACRPVDADRLRAAPQGVAVALRTFHRSGLRLPARFWVPRLLDEYASVVGERGGTLPGVYEQARGLAARIASVLPPSEPVPCHDDLLPSNLLTAADGCAGEGAMLVDWEYAGMGHWMFDLGNLSVNNEFDERADERLLCAYFGRPPTAGQRAGLRLMRLMSDAREAAWGVVQGVISELEFDFAAYAEHHFARLTAAARDPRLDEWLAAAAL